MSGGLIVRSLSQWEDAIGAEALNNLISAFSCPLNPEVECFLTNKAVQSTSFGLTKSMNMKLIMHDHHIADYGDMGSPAEGNNVRIIRGL